MTVPHADPAIPQCRPWTNHTLRTMLRPKPPTAATSGVRVSWRPRRTPVVARTTSMAGMPSAEIRRYVTAWARAASDAPKTRQTGSARTATTTVVTAPRAMASHVPSMPAAIAPGARPGAELAGDDGGRAVREEDEDVGRGQQHGAGDTEPGQGCDAEAADDGGVGEQEERLGDEREERRHGEPQHLAVLAPGELAHVGAVAWAPLTVALVSRARARPCGCRLGARARAAVDRRRPPRSPVRLRGA